MRLLRFICWLKNEHTFEFPTGDPNTIEVDLEAVKCLTCDQDLLALVAYHKDITREEVKKQYESPILHPPKVVQEPKRLEPVDLSATVKEWSIPKEKTKKDRKRNGFGWFV